MLHLIKKILTRKRTRKAAPPSPTTYMGMPLTADNWHKIIGYAAYDAALPLDTIHNPQCQRAYIAAAILIGGSDHE